jgi:hypothetical protein
MDFRAKGHTTNGNYLTLSQSAYSVRLTQSALFAFE